MSGLTADVINEFLKRPPREGLELRGDFEVQLCRVVMATIDLVHLLDDQDNCNIFVTAVNDLRQLISEPIAPNGDHHKRVNFLRKLRTMLDAHTDYVDRIVGVLPKD